MGHTRAKRLLGAACFALLFLLVWQFLAGMLAVLPEPENPDRNAALFFRLPAGRVDCLMLGSSHAYCGFCPQQLYDDYGIVSAQLCTSSQMVQNSYYLLRQALLTQRPKVVVLETLKIAAAADPVVRGFQPHYFSGFGVLPDLSVYKWEDWAGLGQYPEAQAGPEQCLQLLRFRGDLSKLSAAKIGGYLADPLQYYSTFGFLPTDTVCPLQSLEHTAPEEAGLTILKLEEQPEYEYLEKIYALSLKYDFELVLARTPYCRARLDRGLAEQGKQWAGEKKVPYLDYFELAQQVGLELDRDFRDIDHVNYWGAQKLTAHLGWWLAGNTELEDRRGQPGYELWQRRAYDYAAVEERLQEAAAHEKAEG